MICTFKSYIVGLMLFKHNVLINYVMMILINFTLGNLSRILITLYELSQRYTCRCARSYEFTDIHIDKMTQL